MTAIRNFPDAPARFARPAANWPHRADVRLRLPAFVAKLWQALGNQGQRRAARELELLAERRALGDPVFARQLRAAAAACRRRAAPTSTPSPRNPS